LHGLTHWTLSNNLILQQFTQTQGHSYIRWLKVVVLMIFANTFY